MPNPNTGPIGDAILYAQNLFKFPFASSFGLAASAGSAFLATNGDIGQITVANSGAGLDSIGSAFVALGSGFLLLPLGYFGPLNLNLAVEGLFTGNAFIGIPRLVGPTNVPIAAVTSINPPVANVYGAGDILNFRMNFTGSVNVMGQPTLVVLVGSQTERALYVSGSGSSQLTFSLDIDSGDAGNVTIPSGTTVQTDLNNRITDSSTGFQVTQLTPGAVNRLVSASTRPHRRSRMSREFYRPEVRNRTSSVKC